MHKCKCAVCNQEFDRDKIQAVRYNGRRYAHYECFPQGELMPCEDENKVNLDEYIKQLFKTDRVSQKIRKQINQYINEYNYTYVGILKTLQWWYEVKKQDIEKSNKGIGIVPYIYADAAEYYGSIENAQARNENKTEKDFETRIYEVNIDSPYLAPMRKKLFNLEEGE